MFLWLDNSTDMRISRYLSLICRSVPCVVVVVVGVAVHVEHVVAGVALHVVVVSSLRSY